MLSRVAERLYWMARYVERVENTARLLRVYNLVVLDLPRGSELGWDVMLRITATEPAFRARNAEFDEAGIVAFLVTDSENSASVLSSLRMVRENIRTTREVLPAEAWELINELYIYAASQAERIAGRKQRYEFLGEVIAYCQQFTGLLQGTLSRDHAYAFTRVGRNLERADMTTRILDVAAGALLTRVRSPLPFDALLWMSVLQSLSALHSYRLRVGPRVTGEGVTGYLLHDLGFPRSVRHCLEALRDALDGLPRAERAEVRLGALGARLGAADPAQLVERGLHEYVDKLQLGLIDLHEAIADTWFTLDAPGLPRPSA